MKYLLKSYAKKYAVIKRVSDKKKNDIFSICKRKIIYAKI